MLPKARKPFFFAMFIKPKFLLTFICVAQILFFISFAVLTKGTWLRGDNFLYEKPAWNWALGNGFTINRNEWEDPYLTQLYYTAHPEKADSEFIPSATFPVGYSYFLGMIYALVGHSNLAAIIANLILLLITVWLMYLISYREFKDKAEFYFMIGLISFFPLWAFSAAAIMGDVLHIMLLTLFAFIYFVKKPTFIQVIAAGFILGLAVVVRPYVIFLPICLLIGGWILRCSTFNLKNTLTITVVCCIIFSIPILGNYYYFAKPIITSKGLGDGLWLSTQKDIFTDYMSEEEMFKKMQLLGVEDFHRYAENQILLEDAVQQIKAHPLRDAVVTLTSMPRLWVTLGSTRAPNVVKIVLLIIFGSLFFLMIFGGFLVRKSQSPIFVGSIVIISYFTLVFAHLNCEGRYVLPARFFSFLLVSFAIGYFWRLYLFKASRTIKL